jgi:uncharacterized iron-regulated membrane protein
MASVTGPMNPASRKARRRPKDLWIKIHLYLGLWLGLLFAIIGLTGSYNVYKDELDRLFNPSLFAAERGRAPLPFSRLIEAASQNAPPGSEFAGLKVRSSAPATAIIGFAGGDTDVVHEIHVERSTGRYLGTRVQGGSLSEIILHLHAYFYLDTFTTRVTGVLGILLLISAVSGLYIWWPKGSFQSNLKVHLRGSRRRFHFELHRTSGAIAALLLIVSCFTGLSLIFPEPFTAVAGSPDVDVASDAAPAGPVSLDEAVAMAEARYPAMNVRWVDVTGDPPEYRIILRNYGNWVLHSPDRRLWISQATGQIVRMRDPSTLSAPASVVEWFWPIHAGEALGPVGRAMTFIVGLVPSLLFVTGLRLWMIRRPRSGKP